MDRTQLLTAIKDRLLRIPAYIGSANINQVREFRKWHQQTTKQLTKANLTQLQSIYLDVTNRYGW